ncbi:hypothetical protein KIW84_040906 [Lathyrus oleraceus]|uniref:Uncharacterized protein n=1 Tax=Pisum sativum TaxID=3888 RepID=A0A9D4X6T8_PEA|nr:hypothetical protein KIW84_040906 [Pisum sativum]
MAEPDIIGITNDKARSTRDYAVFDPSAMNTGIIRPEITVVQFKFKPMMFQMLQAIGQYSGSAHEDPHLHLRQFLEFQTQGASIKNLENQVGKIVTALSYRNMGTLPNSTKASVTTSGAKSIETCKPIKLRSGKECEGSTSQQSSGELTPQDTSAEKESTEEPTSEEQRGNSDKRSNEGMIFG